MRLSILAVVGVSVAALPAMSRPVSSQYARGYDDNIMAREPSSEELDRRFLLGGLLHIGKMIGSGISSLVHHHNKKKHKKRDLEDVELYERELGDEDIFARDYEEDLFARELPEEFIFERELPEDGLYEREFYEYEWY